MKRLSKVDTTWSPELAYAIGLIASDGCLSSNGRHIVLVSKDKEQIMNLRAINNEALREKYRVAKEHQLRTLSSRLEAVEGELEKRGLTDVPTEKLFGVLFKLVEALRGEDRPLILQSTSGMELSDSFQQTNTWTA